MVITLLLAGPTWLDRAFMIVPLVIAGVIACNIGQNYWWSPYYKIGLTPTDNGDGYALNVNESGHQAMLPSDEKEPFYRSPYELFGSGQFQHVLIIGAGSGSDTAIGLKYGNVGHIDAVEIDPVIARLGKQFHPEHPFSDPRVDVHVDDGRSFLRKTTDKYDLIIFALPDSLTLTSQFSSLRLESFLFTEESFQEARARLTPDGAIVLYNYYREDWLLRKLAGMLETAFDQPPYALSYGGWGRAGRARRRAAAADAARPATRSDQPYTEIRAANARAQRGPERHPAAAGRLRASWPTSNPAGDDDPTPPTPATDDWPLMYLRVAGAAAGLHRRPGHGGGDRARADLHPGARRRLAQGFSGHMFFLGAAFMLLETRSLVTFSLLFGSTWLVNSLVFFAILCSVMLAIVISSQFPLRPSPPLYGLLLAALLAGVSRSRRTAFLSIDFLPLRYGLASLVAFLPVFLANLVFAGSFKGTGPTADVAFASNLIGIMLGGMLEYASLLIGYRNLLLIVIAFYVLSALLLRGASPRRRRPRRRRACRSPPPDGGRRAAICGRVGGSFRSRTRQLGVAAACGCATRPILQIRPISVSAGGVEVLRAARRPAHRCRSGGRPGAARRADHRAAGAHVSRSTGPGRLPRQPALRAALQRAQSGVSGRARSRKAVHAGGAYAAAPGLPGMLRAGYLTRTAPGRARSARPGRRPDPRADRAARRPAPWRTDLQLGLQSPGGGRAGRAVRHPRHVPHARRWPLRRHPQGRTPRRSAPCPPTAASSIVWASAGAATCSRASSRTRASTRSNSRPSTCARSAWPARTPRRSCRCCAIRCTAWCRLASRRATSPACADFVAALRQTLREDGRRITLIAAVDFAHIGPRFGDPWLGRPRSTRPALSSGDREMLDRILDAGRRRLLRPGHARS